MMMSKKKKMKEMNFIIKKLNLTSRSACPSGETHLSVFSSFSAQHISFSLSLSSSSSSSLSFRLNSGKMSSKAWSSRLVKYRSRAFLIAIITTNMIGNSILVCFIDLITHSNTRQKSCTKVKMWTRLIGTFLRHGKSGWYFEGIKIISIRSTNCKPFKLAAPIYKKMPYNTGMGISLSNGTRKTEIPIVMKISNWVTLCSRTPRNFGFSPGAAVSLSRVNELTWLTERTVAATKKGRPRTEHMTIRMATTNKSRW